MFTVLLQSKGTMLFRKRKQENLLRQSLLNRFKTRSLQEDCVSNEKQNVNKCASDLSEIGERRNRAWSLPSEPELRKYLGPVDERLVKNAEIAKSRRRANESRRYSIQLSSTDLPNCDQETRSRTMSLPRHFASKQTPYNFVRCKWCEAIELPSCTAKEQKLQNDSNDETYIDENGIYTTVLCFTEI